MPEDRERNHMRPMKIEGAGKGARGKRGKGQLSLAPFPLFEVQHARRRYGKNSIWQCSCTSHWSRLMKSYDSLIDCPVSIRANDFVDKLTSGSIRYIDRATNTVVIGLATPLDVDGIRYELAIASPRLERDSLVTLTSGGAMGCGITWIPNSRFDPNIPFDLSWWRGGAAAIADVILL